VVAWGISICMKETEFIGIESLHGASHQGRGAGKVSLGAVGEGGGGLCGEGQGLLPQIFF